MQNQVANYNSGSAVNHRSQLHWHIIGEYPPQPGGVSDYTCAVAAGLASQGDEVHVWCRPCSGAQPENRGVFIHRELGSISRADLRRVGQQLDQFPAPRRLLVQWVPHGFGYRSMNIGFCRWLWGRAARHGDQVEIMAHEPYLDFGRNWRQCAAALVHRLMTILLLRAASRVWMSIPGWEERLRPYALGRDIPFQWLPVPSGIPLVDSRSSTEGIRQRYVSGSGLLIAHFGTYGWPITSLLEPILVGLNQEPANQRILLMGIGSEEYREALLGRRPELAGRILATGALSSQDVSRHVSACDLLIQPYPDGVSSRRTSVMVGLCHGKPVVTTIGPLSEPLWKDGAAVALARAGDREEFVSLARKLAADATERERIGLAARALYDERFDISQTIGSLRRAAGAVEPLACVS